MVVFGKRIQLFLVDGTPNGRWICELSNWTGIAYKIPRTYVLQSEKRSELSSPGVYFLFGRDEEVGRSTVYIGETENLFNRLKEHLAKRDDWNEVVAFISKDSNLNKAHIKFLENRFHEIACECNRYSVSNGCTPTKSTVSEAEQEELKEFVYNARILVNTLGHKVFEPLAEVASANKEFSLFYVSAGTGKAKGIPTSDGFVLLKGSSIHEKAAESLNNGIRKKVEENRENGQIINNVLQDNLLFSSSSAAAAFAVGYSISGPQQWKMQNGRSLKQFETDQEGTQQN